MKHYLLLAEFMSTPWAMQDDRLAAFTALVSRWSAGVRLSEIEIEAAIGADKQARDTRRDATARAGGGGIAVLPLYGAVTQRGNMAGNVSGSGGVSTQQFAQALRAAVADDTVGQILIDIDSPGGSVYGVGELAAEIFDARSKKPVVGIANSCAASAAYWLGAQCSQLYCTPGGEVGSIGVKMVHEDVSKALEADGISPTIISAGKFKSEGSPYGPLSDESKAFLQSRVEDYYGAFTKAVAKGRGAAIAQVRDGYGQGRCIGADAALAEGMIDGIATFDDVVAKMTRNAKAARSASRVAQAKNTLAMMQ